MRLDIGSFMFNMTLKPGGTMSTPSWGTALGQGKEHKFKFNDSGNWITSLVYTCVDDIENIKCEFGRGGSKPKDEYSIVLASLYKKVYVNNELINDAKFLLCVVKELVGVHTGRKTLKYGPNMRYNDFSINEECFKLIKDHFHLTEESAWFIYEMYTKNQDELYLKMYIADKEKSIEFDTSDDRKKYVEKIIAESDIKIRKIGGNNKIYYGAPGTGKSHAIDDIIEEAEGKEYKYKFRTTFHPEYSYNDFIGQLLPIVYKDESGNNCITYDFKEGPFTLALEKAYNTPDKMVYLIVEEMSRGNCAAIFGDIFQLLDREKDGWSTYDVDNEVIANFIGLSDNKIKIPSNLCIFGTVNTSDQNVFVMDTAFKRRFEWEYQKTKPKEPEKNNVDIKIGDVPTTWVKLYQCINKFICSKDKLALGEDKQIGHFFVKFDDGKYKEKIKDKLLQYLWYDVQEASYKEEISLFDRKIMSFADLYEEYEKDKQIFSEDFLNELKLMD